MIRLLHQFDRRMQAANASRHLHRSIVVQRLTGHHQADADPNDQAIENMQHLSSVGPAHIAVTRNLG